MNLIFVFRLALFTPRDDIFRRRHADAEIDAIFITLMPAKLPLPPLLRIRQRCYAAITFSSMLPLRHESFTPPPLRLIVHADAAIAAAYATPATIWMMNTPLRLFEPFRH